jgi:eukaryotic-like serine/threonine-protein kinase
VDNRSGRGRRRPTVLGVTEDLVAGEPASPSPPVVPGYVLEALLGRGGSGEVWRAAPRRGGPAVAVKVLVQGDPERQAREAALLGELDHPHLVRLVEVVHQPRRGGEPRVALVLELLAGGSLAALLARRRRLRPGEVVTAVAPVAAALAHAHEHGVVHGDLSPGNIVFTADGRPVLTDLGVARVLGESASGEVTPPYVDPTVARGGAPGPASDVFGVAAAAFHALTGVAPWNAATPADTLSVAAAGFLPDLRELAPEAPDDLVAVILRGLAADPHDRGSAAAFALDLRHAVRPEPVRLPATGSTDVDLARTGQGPRTELTHLVPGRRARPGSPSADRGRAGRWRRAVPRPATGHRRPVLVPALAVAGLLAAGWTGARWVGDDAAREAAPIAAAVTAAAPSSSRAPSPGQEPATEPPEATVDPASIAEWQSVVSDLYRARGRALVDGAVARLDAVYTDDSHLRAADARHLDALAAAGEALRGFAPEVVTVTEARASGDVVTLRLVDRWPAYAVVAAAVRDGPVLRTEPGRGESAVRLVLARTPDGWRIASAERLT